MFSSFSLSPGVSRLGRLDAPFFSLLAAFRRPPRMGQPSPKFPPPQHPFGPQSPPNLLTRLYGGCGNLGSGSSGCFFIPFRTFATNRPATLLTGGSDATASFFLTLRSLLPFGPFLAGPLRNASRGDHLHWRRRSWLASRPFRPKRLDKFHNWLCRKFGRWHPECLLDDSDHSFGFRLHRLQQRYDWRSDGRRSRLDMEKQLQRSRRRLFGYRNAEHPKRAVPLPVGGTASSAGASGSRCIVTVSGTGSTFSNGGEAMYVGQSGAGLLDIIDGGVASVRKRLDQLPYRCWKSIRAMGVHLTPVTVVMEQSPTAARSASSPGRPGGRRDLYAHLRRHMVGSGTFTSHRRHLEHHQPPVHRLQRRLGHVRFAGFDRPGVQPTHMVGDN